MKRSWKSFGKMGKKKKGWKSEESLWDLEDTHYGSLRRKKESWAEGLFKEVTPENFPNLEEENRNPDPQGPKDTK